MPDPHASVPVVESKLAGSRQVLLTLEHPAFVDAHTASGQYAKLAFEEGGVPRPYAIASPPGNGGRFEFLLKLPEERVGPALDLGPGDRVQMGRPQGKGFPVDKAAGKELWLFAVGSGVAPLRAVIEHVLPRRNDIGPITLLYGVRDPDELVFTQRYGDWAGHGVRVVPTVSRPKSGGWDGRTGYVQEHLPKAFERPEAVVAFVCGLPEMDRDVSAALLARGVGPEQVFRNW